MEWRQINGYHYSVSDTGLVRNDNTGCVLKPFACGYGNAYLGVKFTVAKHKYKNFKVHRLVAEAFIPKGTGAQWHWRNEVNHKDLDTHHNHKDNLEWMSREENERHKHFMRAHESIGGYDEAI